MQKGAREPEIQEKKHYAGGGGRRKSDHAEVTGGRKSDGEEPTSRLGRRQRQKWKASKTHDAWGREDRMYRKMRQPIVISLRWP